MAATIGQIPVKITEQLTSGMIKTNFVITISVAFCLNAYASVNYGTPAEIVSGAENVLVGKLLKRDQVWTLQIARSLKGSLKPGALIVVYPSSYVFLRTPEVLEGQDVVFCGAYDENSRLLSPACPVGSILPYDLPKGPLVLRSFLETIRFSENALGIQEGVSEDQPGWGTSLPAIPRVTLTRVLLPTSTISENSSPSNEPPANLMQIPVPTGSRTDVKSISRDESWLDHFGSTTLPSGVLAGAALGLAMSAALVYRREKSAA